MPTVTSANKFRYKALGLVTSATRLRYSTNTVQSGYTPIRYKATRSITSANRLRYLAMSAEYASAILTGAVAADPDSLPQVSILADGTELCPAPYVLQVTHTENAPARWTIGIQDHTGYYHPKNQSSPWVNKLGRGKTMVAQVTWEGASYHLSGKSTGYSHSRSFTRPGSIDFTWSGVDNSQALFRTGVTLATLRTKANLGTIYTTKTAVADLLDSMGIACNLDGMEASPIRLQHRQDGRPGDWFQQLLDVLWHKWIMVGDTLYVYKPGYGGPTTWAYGADAYILEDSLQVDAPTYANEVTARRAKEARSGTTSPVEHQAFGQQTQEFSPAIEGIFWRKLAEQGGRFSDFRLYSNGSLVAVREALATFSGGLATAAPGPIDKVIYTWGNLPGQATTSGYGKIQFLGAEQDKAEQGFVVDETYSVRRRNATSVDAGDQVNHTELQPNTLIADSAILERHADGYLIEQAADAEPQDFRFPLNLLMFPGQRVLIEDPVLGTQNRYIRSVTHSFSDDPANRFTRAQTVWIDPDITLEDVEE